MSSEKIKLQDVESENICVMWCLTMWVSGGMRRMKEMSLVVREVLHLERGVFWLTASMDWLYRSLGGPKGGWEGVS